MARRPVHIAKTMLSPRKRATLRASEFAVPSERKYPINDLFHARLALTYVLTPSNAAYRDEVVGAVLARYPELQFWWASRSKRLTTPARRKVANPSSISEDIMPVYTLNSSHRSANKRKVSNPVSLRERVTLRRNGLSEDGMTVSNPKRPSYKMVGVVKPRSRSGGTAQKAGLAKGQSLMARAAVAYRAGEYASMQDALRGVARARKSNPAMPVQIVAPTLPKKSSRRMPRQHTVANPHYAEEMDEDYYEVQAREDKMLRHALGQNVGLNADWADDAYYIAPRGGKANRTSGAIYLNNLDGGDWSLVQVTYDEKEGSSEYAPLKTFGSAREAVNYISSHRAELERKATEMRANPRRKGSKSKAKRSSGRTVAQSNAARAMTLFHSGQASSLAEAWDMIRRGR